MFSMFWNILLLLLVCFQPAVNARVVQKDHMLSLQDFAYAFPVHYREVGAPIPGAPSILFLHGMRFTSAEWEKIGALQALENLPTHAVALDLPGFGESGGGKGLLSKGKERARFLSVFLDDLKIINVLVVAASYGGNYLFPFLHEFRSRVVGIMPIAAAGLETYSHTIGDRDQRNSGNLLPVITLWGSKDNPNGAYAKLYQQAFPQQQKIVFQDAGHPCYLDNPSLFISVLTGFYQSNIEVWVAQYNSDLPRSFG